MVGSRKKREIAPFWNAILESTQGLVNPTQSTSLLHFAFLRPPRFTQKKRKSRENVPNLDCIEPISS